MWGKIDWASRKSASTCNQQLWNLFDRYRKLRLKEKKAKLKVGLFWLCQKMARLLIFTRDGFLFKPIDAVEITFVLLAGEHSFSC